MEPESMVHALEKIHALLGPGGDLINIQPDGELVEFYAVLDEGEQFIGYMLENDDYVEYFQAMHAIEMAANAGLFQIQKVGEFEFCNYAGSFHEMKSYLDKNWSDAVITEEVIASARNLEDEHGAYKTILREKIKLSLLRSI
jgi:hypothetical protein